MIPADKSPWEDSAQALSEFAAGIIDMMEREGSGRLGGLVAALLFEHQKRLDPGARRALPHSAEPCADTVELHLPEYPRPHGNVVGAIGAMLVARWDGVSYYTSNRHNRREIAVTSHAMAEKIREAFDRPLKGNPVQPSTGEVV